MARPLNKKYFGNRNAGSASTSADDNIGGGGIASINFSNAGTFIGNSNVAPITIPSLPAPTLPNGVQATWSLTFEVESVSTGAGKTNLAVGDTFGHTSLPGMIAKVTDISGANAIFSVTTTGASRGNALALADIPQDTLGFTLDKIAGTGTATTFLVDVSFHVRTVTITEEGSGYIGNETFTFTKPGTTSGSVPVGTIVLTQSTSVPYTDDAFPAIIAYAQTTSGGSRAIGDIVSQKGSTRFRVLTTDGTATCSLRTDGGSGEGTMDITAYDSDNGEYWVKRISANNCVLVQKGSGGGTQFANDTKVPWNFDAAVAGVSVKIQNA